MKNMSLQPLIYSKVDYWNQFKQIDANLHSHTSIPTKYAYLGWHGAKIWYKLKENVHSKLSKTNELLNKHLPSILDTVFGSKTGKKRNSSEAINIISLGIGSGDEDLHFLSIMNNLKDSLSSKINYYAVDYSSDLLFYSLRRLTDFYTNLITPQIRINKLMGLCFDIDYPWVTHSIFKSNSRYNKYKLFHLLGFTLGNNSEEPFLRNILALMKEDDYLLFDIDFSADDDKIIESVHKSYQNKTEISNQFLLNSIYYLSQIISRTRTTNSFAVSVPGISGVEIIYDELKYLVSQSDIPNTVSLTRKHKYHKHRGGNFSVDESICDFSNKYKSTDFIEWLKRMSSKLGFEISNPAIPIYKSDSGLTGLVLIKKVKVKSKKGQEVSFSDSHNLQIRKCITWLNKEKHLYKNPVEVTDLIGLKDKWSDKLINDITNENCTISSLMNYYKDNLKNYIND